jgi:hypothetical protein
MTSRDFIEADTLSNIVLGANVAMKIMRSHVRCAGARDKIRVCFSLAHNGHVTKFPRDQLHVTAKFFATSGHKKSSLAPSNFATSQSRLVLCQSAILFAQPESGGRPSCFRRTVIRKLYFIFSPFPPHLLPSSFQLPKTLLSVGGLNHPSSLGRVLPSTFNILLVLVPPLSTLPRPYPLPHPPVRPRPASDKSY